MITAADNIGRLGEHLLAEQLQREGYVVYLNTRQTGATDISALKGPDRKLIQVKASLQPAPPGRISPGERGLILLRAAAEKATAWEARLVISEEGKVVGRVEWNRVVLV